MKYTTLGCASWRVIQVWLISREIIICVGQSYLVTRVYILWIQLIWSYHRNTCKFYFETDFWLLCLVWWTFVYQYWNQQSIWESYLNYWTIKWLSSTLFILFVELYFILLDHKYHWLVLFCLHVCANLFVSQHFCLISLGDFIELIIEMY